MPLSHQLDALYLRYLFDCRPQLAAYQLTNTIRLLTVMEGGNALHPAVDSFMGLFYWVPPENVTTEEMVILGLMHGRTDVHVLTQDEAESMLALEGLSLYAT